MLASDTDTYSTIHASVFECLNLISHIASLHPSHTRVRIEYGRLDIATNCQNACRTNSTARIEIDCSRHRHHRHHSMLIRPALKVVRNSVVQCPQILSRAFVCLTVSLVSSSIPASGFAALHKTFTRHNSQWHRAMATTDLSADDVGISPSKILLHDRDADVYERDLIGTVTPPSANGLKIISWNVAGLRGTMKKNPEVLNELVDQQDPDILCLQVRQLREGFSDNKTRSCSG